MKIFFLLSLLFLFPETSDASGNQLWFRSPGEYLAHRSVRIGNPTDVSSRLLTDGKRFDAGVGKRISLLTWAENGPASAWNMGIELGMLASLQRYSRSGQLTFATNTFDGFFGAYLGVGWDGWIVLTRFGHLSAHLVDNSPNFLNPVSYSQFWNEIIFGKSIPNPEEKSDWDLHLQGSLGFTHTSTPKADQPRASLGISFGHGLDGPDSIAIVTSADVIRAGLQGQNPSYSFFAGFGTLNRPEATRRPFRAGIAVFRGSDYRNQNFNRRQKWTTFEVSADL